MTAVQNFDIMSRKYNIIKNTVYQNVNCLLGRCESF